MLEQIKQQGGASSVSSAQVEDDKDLLNLLLPQIQASFRLAVTLDDLCNEGDPHPSSIFDADSRFRFLNAVTRESHWSERGEVVPTVYKHPATGVLSNHSVKGEAVSPNWKYLDKFNPKLGGQPLFFRGRNSGRTYRLETQAWTYWVEYLPSPDFCEDDQWIFCEEGQGIVFEHRNILVWYNNRQSNTIH